MRKRSGLALFLALGLGLVAILLLTGGLSMVQASQATLHAGPVAAPAGPDDWFGAWQYGPDMDATIWGGPAGEGIARFSGHFYTGNNLIYFLGGRQENDNTTGTIFTFDPVSGVYADTGADMVTPVSNYFIGRISNDGQGNGPGLYVAGGRMGSGTNTDALQVYYPDTNAVQVIATDPVPGSVRAVGGLAVVADKLYVFGGFNGTIMFAETYVYDPLAAEGARWTNLNCDLPTPRSYIATAVVGSKIYALGGDEFIGGGLVPLADTLVLDTQNLALCWQDGVVADLPEGFENGDAPAVYVDEGYLAGGIYVIGGVWPQPGPYNWVFRYDLAADTWETSFPVLNQARRNQAAVWVPGLVTEGLGDGVPGLWTFGGYDGLATNSMTNLTEFFSIVGNDVILLPDAVEKSNVAGGSVTFNMTVLNITDTTHTYNISYLGSEPWTVTTPATVGPVPPDGNATFAFGVEFPAVVPCPTTGIFTITVTSQSDPAVNDSQAVGARVACGIGGTVFDANTTDPLPDAYIWMEDISDPINLYYEAFTDAAGDYSILDVAPGTYRLYATGNGYQPSFYPDGWPSGAVTVTLGATSLDQDFTLVGSQMSAAPAGFDVTLDAGTQMTYALILTNSGTGPLVYDISLLDGSQPLPALAALPQSTIPGLGRIDARVRSDLETSPDGTADFVVLMSSQANLSAAYGISDWPARGQYVFDTLRRYAETTQKSVRAVLDAQGVDYQPIYVVNGLAITAGRAALVDELALRPDVAQIVGNHAIEIEHQPAGLSDLLAANSPDTVEWGIAAINADDVWTDYGVRGEGIVVANIDTGVQYDHPALFRQYRGWDGATYDHNYNWWDPYHQGPGGGTIPADSDGHGTHTMGTMIGEDAGQTNQIGVAPGARWMACDGGDDVSGYLLTNELLECADWLIAPWDLTGSNPDPAMRPHVVNNSWGGGPEDYWYAGAIEAWRAAGIFVAFSNGNSGPLCETVHSPGDYWHNFAVAASDSSSNIASFSSRGPSLLDGNMKPQITAPGVAVRSSVPNNAYALYSGTSMASPHAAGSVALLWSAAPELIGQIDATAWVLEQGAVPRTTTEGCGGDLPTDVPNNTWGYGILDIHAAVTLADTGTVVPSWLQVSPLGGLVPAGSTGTVEVGFYAPNAAGTYTAVLWLTAYDPYVRQLQIPLTLEVNQTDFKILLPVVFKN
jgi:hypothetical protein